MSGTGTILTADVSLLELFRIEIENHSGALDSGLVEAESNQSPDKLEPLMRAAHSIKGASRIVGLDLAVKLAHAMEDLLSAAQHGKIILESETIDLLLHGNDIFRSLLEVDLLDMGRRLDENEDSINKLSEELKNILSGKKPSITQAIIPQTTPKIESIQAEEPKTTGKEMLPAVRQQAAKPTVELHIDTSMLDLFNIEVENHTKALETGLVEIEDNQTSEKIEPLMRAAHSIKGAARIIGLDPAVRLAHSMEDVLSTAQKGKLTLYSESIDVLFRSNDIIKALPSIPATGISDWLNKNTEEIDDLCTKLSKILKGEAISTKVLKMETAITTELAKTSVPEQPKEITIAKEIPQREQTVEKADISQVRVLAENLNRLMGLAGECLVQARSAKPFSASLIKIKNLFWELDEIKESVYQRMKVFAMPEEIAEKFEESNRVIDKIRDLLLYHIDGFEQFSRRLDYISDKLYAEAIATRMRPFSDGLHGFQRMIRDVSKQLGKKVNFIVEGSSTRVDRDILEKLESPLNHLIRNAIDHGIELPEERVSKGKQPEGKLILEARHSSGLLMISLKDDGKGIDPDNIRRKIVEKGYTTSDIAAVMSIPELMEFLFLPGFSTTKQVTEISGRGVGLDIVFSMVHEVSGIVRAESVPGNGSTFFLQLPITLSVIRTLLVEICDEIYALPLSRIDRILEVKYSDLKMLEERQYCSIDGDNIGIIHASQVFKLPRKQTDSDTLNVIVISDRMSKYGIVVDEFLMERDLVVIPLDQRLGKVPNIAAGAILEDSNPVLILDVDDLVRSVDKILNVNKPKKLGISAEKIRHSRKRVLIVDDSLTVREVERKLLENRGYD
ncbi:MAG: two-component system, chemotaxis family, sensor histidine kinase and response regulator WspE, partial [Bacteroidota bacterium]|nr:two-component system, chemotaxis family, sensor histidine kinase and response regulator WspE [Bacteroidota bacterium]